MKKIIIIVGVVLGIILPFTNKPTANINGQEFYLYIARSPEDKQIGLSKYEKLSENYGMLFLFDKPSFYSFWMKNMKFPIDIIFIKENTIIDIHANAPNPKSENDSLEIYQSRAPSDSVLEINAGLSKKYNFKEGDKVAFKNLKLW